MAPRPGRPGRPDRGHHRGGDLVRRGSRRRRRRGGDRDGGWRRGGRHASVRRGRCRSRGLRGRVPVVGGGRLGADRDGRARLFRTFRGEPRPELRERGALRGGRRGRVGPVVLIPVEIFILSSSSSLHSAASSSYSGLSTELSRKSPTASPAFAAAALALAARPESAPCSIRGRDSPSEANGPRFSLLAFLANLYLRR